MLQQLLNQCKELRESADKSRFTLIEQSTFQHSDFLTVAWLLAELSKGRKVTFLTFRENYSHFLSLSKKIGRSFESFLKSKQLHYYECFESSFCSELPLTQTTPSTYVTPPSLVHRLHAMSLQADLKIEQGSVFIIDAVSFPQQISLVFWLYELGCLNKSRMIFAGCLEESNLAQIFELEADMHVKLRQDVGGFGKISLRGDGKQASVLWKNVNCKLEFSQHIAI